MTCAENHDTVFIMQDKITDLLIEIQNAVSHVEKINNGGCGVFAALVAARLKKAKIPARVKVGQMDSYFCSRTDKKALIKAKRNGASSASDFYDNDVRMDHLIVEVGKGKEKIHFDSQNLIPAAKKTVLFNATVLEGCLVPKQALVVANSRNWNPTFNRKQIPQLTKSINKVFKKYFPSIRWEKMKTLNVIP